MADHRAYATARIREYERATAAAQPSTLRERPWPRSDAPDPPWLWKRLHAECERRGFTEEAFDAVERRIVGTSVPWAFSHKAIAAGEAVMRRLASPEDAHRSPSALCWPRDPSIPDQTDIGRPLS